MKHILFVGNYDKTDLLFYIAKLVSQVKRVLIADCTLTSRYMHAYPKVEMNTTLQEYDHFDVAEGLKSYSDLEVHLKKGEYDIVLIDAENEEALRNWPLADMYYLVSSFENPVMQSNAKLLQSYFQEKMISELYPFTKVLFEVNGTHNESYLNDLLERHPIHWEDTLTYYPDERDLTRKTNNQFSSTVKLKGISGPYKDVIRSIVSRILEQSPKETLNLWKQTERRG
ncbi:hypothetical protein PUW24_00025 (plasmid) [Paenibacillus urinalis]|uniref:CobW/HypB/UreG nucleotide-binding domain-containing protein n=1 Tax=Paenibacillus urinalis TaxID=521520 RepID=A0AAX3N6W5_9BACL|nr:MULTISPECIES: hypothetical protein [Paenibacillus]MCM3130506.1 hypothetical protein [Paenibacillus sp. MER 78]WDH85392.1 hypothetical protein PUW23_25485 [Paenibacillus urinalis]WDH95169.1 hypothetical protein PUW24_00025 [Paenibacillus urinalis]WDI05358.1 hypothetical protein PUW25_26565 [Paenibacillus urinalis]